MKNSLDLNKERYFECNSDDLMYLWHFKEHRDEQSKRFVVETKMFESFIESAIYTTQTLQNFIISN